MHTYHCTILLVIDQQVVKLIHIEISVHRHVQGTKYDGRRLANDSDATHGLPAIGVYIKILVLSVK